MNIRNVQMIQNGEVTPGCHQVTEGDVVVVVGTVVVVVVVGTVVVVVVVGTVVVVVVVGTVVVVVVVGTVVVVVVVGTVVVVAKSAVASSARQATFARNEITRSASLSLWRLRQAM